MRESNVPKYLVSQFIFWLLFFALCRIVFIAHVYHTLPKNVGFFQALGPLWHGLYLDFSTVAYIIAIPFILLIPNIFFKVKFTNKITFYYTCLILFIVAVIVSSELPLFDEWGVKLNYKAIKYLQHPSEVFNSASNWSVIWGLLKIAMLTFIGIFSFKKWFYRPLKPIKLYFGIPFFVVTPFILVLLFRGGFQQIPIEQSDVYYSRVNTLNEAATNSFWNLGQSILKNKRYMNHNPYIDYSPQEAKAIVANLYKVKKDSTTEVLNTKHPNIVLIIQEGWSSDLVKALGGYSGITPWFNKLIQQGLLFTNIYATGARSDQGMAAIFSAFPAQPTTSIIKQPAKYIHLPCIGRDLQKIGYETSYIFAGQLSYGNIKSYMIYNHFNKLIVGADFPDSLHKSKLGVPDQYMYARDFKTINSLKPPFLAACFTISPHAPYDIPVPYTIHWGGYNEGYLNAVHYADSCMFHFIKRCSTEPWYKNTLFVILSDHSHDSPKKWGFYMPNYHKMPILFYGPALKEAFRGAKVTKLGSQIDLASTLFSQMGVSDTAYHWSKNLLNPYTKPFAFYAIDDGVGWVRPNSYFVWDHTLQRFYGKHFPDSLTAKQELRNGKAYLQRVFQTYLNK